MLIALLGENGQAVQWSTRVPLEMRNVTVKKGLLPLQYHIRMEFCEGEAGHIVASKKVLGLEEGIAKMTSLPCRFFGIRNRGRVERGCIADLTVFSLETIREMGDYLEPWKKPQGIRYVIIKGQIAVREGEPENLRLGKILVK